LRVPRKKPSQTVSGEKKKTSGVSSGMKLTQKPTKVKLKRGMGGEEEEKEEEVEAAWRKRRRRRRAGEGRYPRLDFSGQGDRQ
jgi:hypothetical protein